MKQNKANWWLLISGGYVFLFVGLVMLFEGHFPISLFLFISMHLALGYKAGTFNKE